MFSEITDFAASQSQKSQAIADEQRKRVEFVKQQLKPQYEKAKEELPRLRNAISEAAEFLQVLGQTPNVPQSVAEIASQMVKVMEVGDKQVVAGINAYDRLQFHQIEQQGWVNVFIRDQLFGCDGIEPFLQGCIGRIKTILKALSEATYNREGQILTTDPAPVIRETVPVVSDFDPRAA